MRIVLRSQTCRVSVYASFEGEARQQPHTHSAKIYTGTNNYISLAVSLLYMHTYPRIVAFTQLIEKRTMFCIHLLRTCFETQIALMTIIYICKYIGQYNTEIFSELRM